MTAGNLNLTIYKGGAFSTTITFYQTGTTTPLDYGAGGYASAGTNVDNPVLAFTVDSTNHATGVLVLTATTSQTDHLKLGPVPWAFMSSDGTVWVQGIATVVFTPVKNG